MRQVSRRPRPRYKPTANCYCQTTPDEKHSLTSWTAHLDGALHLLRLRGRKLLESGARYRMFSLLRLQMVRQRAFYT